MHFTRMASFVLVSLITLILSYGCASSVKKKKIDANEKFYLAHNIWIDNKYRSFLNWSRLGTNESRDIRKMAGQVVTISGINYKVGVLLNAGTLVDQVKVGSDYVKFRMARFHLYVIFEIKNKYDSTLNGNQLFDRMFTKNTFDELTAGLPSRQIEAIISGIVLNGMPKEVVLMTFGYPPGHRTPSLESNSWMYWGSKVNMMEVRFDENNLTIKNVIP